jgi:acyl-CoA dehydrogenase
MGWRNEFGGDAFWAEQMGRRVAGLGGHGLWREMVALTDRLAG